MRVAPSEVNKVIQHPQYQTRIEISQPKLFPYQHRSLQAGSGLCSSSSSLKRVSHLSLGTALLNVVSNRYVRLADLCLVSKSLLHLVTNKVWLPCVARFDNVPVQAIFFTCSGAKEAQRGSQRRLLFHCTWSQGLICSILHAAICTVRTTSWSTNFAEAYLINSARHALRLLCSSHSHTRLALRHVKSMRTYDMAQLSSADACPYSYLSPMLITFSHLETSARMDSKWLGRSLLEAVGNSSCVWTLWRRSCTQAITSQASYSDPNAHRICSTLLLILFDGFFSAIYHGRSRFWCYFSVYNPRRLLLLLLQLGCLRRGVVIRWPCS